MSLLMDALKKAEEEKKRAAKRLEEVEADARSVTGEHDIAEDSEKSSDYMSTVELSLEPISQQANQPEEISPALEETVDAREIESEGSVEDVPPNVDISEDSFSEDLTLENTVVNEVLDETHADIDLNDTTIIEGLSTENASAPFDDTFHGVLLDDDDTREVDVYEETLPGVPAETLAEDLGGGEYQPTPVAAQTVFTASQSGKQNKSFRWGIFSVLAILAIGAFIVFYYFSITPVTRQLPSPLVARGIEAVPVPLPQTQTPVDQGEFSDTIISPNLQEQVTAEDSTLAVMESNTEKPVSDSLVTETEVMSETVAKTNDTAQVFEDNLAVEESSALDEVITEQSIQEAPKQINDNVAEMPSEPPAMVMQETVQERQSLIEISKAKKSKQQTKMIVAAFKAYKGGEYVLAKSLYRDLLKEQPDNRDIHLGLAAIAVNEENYADAYKHYIHLLELNPDDALAMSALVSLSNSESPVNDESAIKLLLQKEGEAPFLYFSLGNIYAGQKRWAEAQQAFFDAYRLDTTNADYVLNLAISLDRLGQYSTALDYYKTAIDLAQNTPAKFDFAAVKKRIDTLDSISG